MTERTMFGGQIVRDRLGMDEPTIDCMLCADPATWECQDQALNDHLEWSIVYRWTFCSDHLRTNFRVPDIRPDHYRLVLMPLG